MEILKQMRVILSKYGALLDNGIDDLLKRFMIEPRDLPDTPQLGE